MCVSSPAISNEQYILCHFVSHDFRAYHRICKKMPSQNRVTHPCGLYYSLHWGAISLMKRESDVNMFSGAAPWLLVGSSQESLAWVSCRYH